MLRQLVPGHVGNHTDASGDTFDTSHAPGHVDDEAAGTAESFLLKLTIGKSTREKLRHAQDLLSHAVPSGDVAQVLDRALDALIVELEKRKLGGGSPRRQPQIAAGTRQHSRQQVPSRQGAAPRDRYVPARVRRAVWERERGRCTFVSAGGHRCESRRFLEFDHIDPVARGGRRAHNQYEAERLFGAEFMSRKRDETRRAAAKARARDSLNMPRGMLEETDTVREQIRNVLAGLRNLGCPADQARRAAALTETLQGVTLEERMRAALTCLGRG